MHHFLKELPNLQKHFGGLFGHTQFEELSLALQLWLSEL
jgi:hypothetical protein